MIVYMIRSKAKPELFLKGTPSYHAFVKNGRTWQSIGTLRAFINAVIKDKWRRQDLSDWEIVEYELTPRSFQSVHEVVTPEMLVKLLKG